MSRVFTLIAYEYKKILLRKTFPIAILLMLFVSTFCMVGHTMSTGRSAGAARIQRSDSTIAENREIVHGAAGYLDEAMLDELITKNAEARIEMDSEGYYPAALYRRNIEPWSVPLHEKLTLMLSPPGVFDANSLNNLESGGGMDFYRIREEAFAGYMAYNQYSPGEVDATLAKNNALSTPFYYDYHEGYVNFFTMMNASAVFIVLGAAVCLAPIFSGEYGARTDALLLSSKEGKGKLVTAKILTVISFSLLFTVAGFLLAIATNFGVYSFMGGEVNWQIPWPFTVYPLTMAKALVIYCGISLLAAVSISALVALLSAYTNSFVTITLSALTLFLSMLIDLPGLMNCLFPANMLDPSCIFGARLLNLFGIYLEPYVLIPCIAGVLLLAAVPLARRVFCRHQAR